MRLYVSFDPVNLLIRFSQHEDTSQRTSALVMFTMPSNSHDVSYRSIHGFDDSLP
jgi:hypothetical protein